MDAIYDPDIYNIKGFTVRDGIELLKENDHGILPILAGQGKLSQPLPNRMVATRNVLFQGTSGKRMPFRP
jgi:3-deoxy-D-manno-octulosonate 8-phosphate phosphatase KdsC-like HAD superfamily phosphatase